MRVLLAITSTLRSFNFIPTFLFFFKRFDYLPPSISFRYARFSKELTLHYFFKLFVRTGLSANFFKVILTLFNGIWSFFNLNRLPGTGHIIFLDYFSKLTNIFNRFKFLFGFQFQTLNKQRYKNSPYARSKYELKFRYIPTFGRIKNILKFMHKSLIYLPETTFKKRFASLMFMLFMDNRSLRCFNYTLNLQNYILKKNKRLLFIT